MRVINVDSAAISSALHEVQYEKRPCGFTPASLIICVALLLSIATVLSACASGGGTPSADGDSESAATQAASSATAEAFNPNALFAEKLSDYIEAYGVPAAARAEGASYLTGLAFARLADFGAGRDFLAVAYLDSDAGDPDCPGAEMDDYSLEIWDANPESRSLELLFSGHPVMDGQNDYCTAVIGRERDGKWRFGQYQYYDGRPPALDMFGLLEDGSIGSVVSDGTGAPGELETYRLAALDSSGLSVRGTLNRTRELLADLGVDLQDFDTPDENPAEAQTAEGRLARVSLNQHAGTAVSFEKQNDDIISAWSDGAKLFELYAPMGFKRVNLDNFISKEYSLGFAGNGFEALEVRLEIYYLDAESAGNAHENGSGVGVLAIEEILGMTVDGLVECIELEDVHPADVANTANHTVRWKAPEELKLIDDGAASISPRESSSGIGTPPNAASDVENGKISESAGTAASGTSASGSLDFAARLEETNARKAADPRMGGTTAEMIEAGNDYVNQYDQLMNDAYDYLVSLRGTDEAQLIASQTDWQNNLDQRMESTKAEYAGGSLLGPALASVKMEMQEQRIRELINMIDEAAQTAKDDEPTSTEADSLPVLKDNYEDGEQAAFTGKIALVRSGSIFPGKCLWAVIQLPRKVSFSGGDFYERAEQDSLQVAVDCYFDSTEEPRDLSLPDWEPYAGREAVVSGKVEAVYGMSINQLGTYRLADAHIERLL